VFFIRLFLFLSFMPFILGFASCILLTKAPVTDAMSASAKAAVVKSFDLTGTQIAALDTCNKAMASRKQSSRARNRDLGTYCGCLAKEATVGIKDPHKPDVMQFLAKLQDSYDMTYDDVAEILPTGAYRGSLGDAISSIQSAANLCSDIARNVAQQEQNRRR